MRSTTRRESVSYGAIGNELYADTEVVYPFTVIVVERKSALSGVPRTFLLRYKLEQYALPIDEIVRCDLMAIELSNALCRVVSLRKVHRVDDERVGYASSGTVVEVGK
jgi:hypothetical protein